MQNSRLAMRYEELAQRRRRLYHAQNRRRESERKRRREQRLNLMVACALPVAMLLIALLAWLNWGEF